ncbi:MAG: FAD-dependent oxidoreductase [Rhodospirillaceae bacterium]|nr:FAD-dependent oxidoreductase [Rhodospirillaceae bacterium]MCY4237048.1 FAD-dependent oxidoreductase [Rhodospirillaceae bacterium]
MTLQVAIVGSGPSSFYTAEALLRAVEKVEIDIVERLPTPYGLIRGGVAPDHAKTKNVSRSYEKTARDPRVRYFGNVTLGPDVSLDDLRSMYDAVVLATGAAVDRPLGIPGDDKPGVLGVAEFVGWYNGHPDFRDLDPPLDIQAVVVIGVGNVAVDVARVLTKTPAEMAATDLTDYAAAAIHAAPIRDVYVFGRRGPHHAKFSNVELREMGQLENSAPVLDPAQLPAELPQDWAETLNSRDLRISQRNLSTLHDFAVMDAGTRQKRVHFSFYANPVEVLGDERVVGIRLERTRIEDGRAVGTGETFEVACGIVIPAIGYRSDPIDGVPFEQGRSKNVDGRINKGLYAVGWIKRGPSGVIGSNKPDGYTAAHQIVEDCGDGDGKPGRMALETHLKANNIRVVTFSDWKQIEAAEESAATAPAPRRKFDRIADMLALLE